MADLDLQHLPVPHHKNTGSYSLSTVYLALCPPGPGGLFISKTRKKLAHNKISQKCGKDKVFERK